MDFSQKPGHNGSFLPTLDTILTNEVNTLEALNGEQVTDNWRKRIKIELANRMRGRGHGGV